MPSALATLEAGPILVQFGVPLGERSIGDSTRYGFRVFARNAAGQGPASSVGNAVPLTFLTAPRSLTATPTNLPGQVRLTWVTPLSNGGSGIIDYVIQRSPNGTSGWTTVGDGVSTARAYTVTG